MGKPSRQRAAPAKPVMMDSTAVDGRNKSISPGLHFRVMRVTCWSRAGNGTVPMRGVKYWGSIAGIVVTSCSSRQEIEVISVQWYFPQRSNISVSREVSQYRGRTRGLRVKILQMQPCGRYDKTANPFSSFRVCMGTIQIKI